MVWQNYEIKPSADLSDANLSGHEFYREVLRGGPGANLTKCVFKRANLRASGILTSWLPTKNPGKLKCGGALTVARLLQLGMAWTQCRTSVFTVNTKETSFV